MAISRLMISAAALLLACVGFVKAQNPPPGWKGKITIENGVRKVLNPALPLYGEVNLELEEELRIGDEKDDRAAFYDLVRFALDSAGCIYIMDAGNSRIQKFDGKGNFLLSFGRKGQGPGEFRQLSDIYVDGRDHVLVYESLGVYASLHDFDGEGAFVRTHKYRFPNVPGVGPKFIQPSVFLAQGSSDLEGRKRELFLLTVEGERLKTVADYPLSPPPPVVKKRMLGNPFESRLFHGAFSSGGGIYGHSSAYRLFTLDKEGNVVAAIEKDAKPVAVTKKDRERLIEDFLLRQEKLSFSWVEKLTREEVRRAYIFSDTVPYFEGIFVDDRDRIYVRRWKRYSPTDPSETFDVFDRNGFFLWVVKFPRYPALLKDGRLYAIQRDPESGYSTFLRYRIKNWDALRR